MSATRKALIVGGLFVALMVLMASLQTIYDRDNVSTDTVGAPDCFARTYLVLQAQSVPSASEIPCIANDHEGWEINETFGPGRSELALTSSDTGAMRWTVVLNESCSPANDAVAVTPTDPNASPFVTSSVIADGLVTRTEWYQFDGACATSTITVPERYDEQRIFSEIDASFRLITRSSLDQYIESRTNGAYGLDPAP